MFILSPNSGNVFSKVIYARLDMAIHEEKCPVCPDVRCLIGERLYGELALEQLKQ